MIDGGRTKLELLAELQQTAHIHPVYTSDPFGHLEEESTMRFMNDYDIDCAIARAIRETQPNRLGAAYVIQHLAEWTNSVSDGWAYWSQPRRAATKLMELADGRHDTDCTDAELAAAVRPVKALLTRCAKERHGLHPDRPMVTAEERELILRGSMQICG